MSAPDVPIYLPAEDIQLWIVHILVLSCLGSARLSSRFVYSTKTTVRYHLADENCQEHGKIKKNALFIMWQREQGK